jgi:hypothetical protein
MRAEPPGRPEPRELALAAALALAVGALYALTFQTRWYGDGPGLASIHALGLEERYYHVLYLPLCDLVQRVLGGDDPFRVVRLMSVVPMALGIGLGYLVLRACAAPRAGTLVALAALALAPSTWFFGTTVEVHALLVASVALVAVVTLYAPWQRPRLALTLVVAAFPLLYCAHQAAFVLGPGWVLLVQYARSRHGTRYTWPQLLLLVGPLLLAALVAAVALSGWVRFGALAPLVGELEKQVLLERSQELAPFAHASPPTWSAEALLPLGVLVPLALLGCARLLRVRWLAPAIAALVLVPTAFFLWWGVYERGGYFLGCALFLAVPVAHLAGRVDRTALALAVPLLVAQAVLGWGALAAWNGRFDPVERDAQVRAALGAGPGTLLSTSEGAPDVRCTLPALEETSLLGFVRNACTRERRLLSPDEIVALLRPFLARLLERGGPVAVELGYARVPPEESPSIAAFAPHLAAIEHDLRARHTVRELEHPDWPLIVLAPRE